jgi:2-polyprenyl-6-methoxyphenol hydroxylase-like FAD-dependent oxidoreductase
MAEDNRGSVGRHAVVIGGSMAGLLAARVLTTYFQRVTIVERDRLPDGPEPRKGVPQARHTHVLLTRGQRILSRLFPDITGALASEGAPLLDWTQDCRLFTNGGWRPRFPSDIRAYACSRDLLECLVRWRVLADPRVATIQECDVVGLLADRSRSRAAGVQLRYRETAQRTDGTGELAADLVVDASGRDSKAPQWLNDLGYPAPPETRINSFLGYASRFYRPPEERRFDWKLLMVTATPPQGTRGALILPVEGGRWHVTLGGVARDYPPTDEDGFLSFARSLPDASVYDAIHAATPLSGIAGYRRTENRLRHYEQMERWLDGFVVVGDAVCAFNPVYGQGMTVAAMGAEALDRCLRARWPAGLAGFSRRFQQDLARVNATPWLLATGADLRFPQTVGGQTGPLQRLTQRYIDQVLATGRDVPRVHKRFVEVLHFIRPPAALISPLVAAPVLRRYVRRRLGGPA